MSHAFHPSILRAYDIRGTYEETLFPKDAYWVGRAFGHVAYEKGARTVCVGRDGRLSSPALSEKLIQGLVEAGLDVKEIGIGPSPMLYFANVHLETDAALMVTGSHNEASMNGVKMSLFHAPFFSDDIQALADVVKKDLPVREGSLDQLDVFDDYVDRLLKGIPLKSSLKVVWDPGNGAAGDVVNALVHKLPGHHTVINGSIDGTFPAHHPDPTVPENLVQLQDKVREVQADIGLAFDGDGDRVGVIDNQGRILWGDQILMLLARDILVHQPGATIIADVKASQAFFEDVKAHGGVPLMWKSGHSHIKSKMAETQASLGGEMSGHIFIADDYYGYDDGIYGALRLLKYVILSDCPLDEHLDSLPRAYSTPEVRFACPEDRKFTIPEEIKRRLQGVDYADLDGVRVNLPDGWWLLRASNTQAALSARCEATTAESLGLVIDHLVTELQQSGLDGEGITLLKACRKDA